MIPARSGSSIKNKNIKNYKQKPLIFHSIDVALKSKFINKILISTDSKRYKSIIEKKYGKKIEVPFLRPKKISGANATDYQWVRHALKFLSKNQNYTPQMIVHLRPTTPNRDVKILDNAIKLFIKKYKDCSSLRSANKFSQPPHKMFKIYRGYFQGYFNFKKFKEYYNLSRQKFSQNYIPNGYVDILKPDIILKSKFLHGKKILPFITNDTNDIDNLNDFKK
tara:strand:- start:780 stop:1445 length:666 start_codon:yes stop_codon:yes gene_type:complete